MAMNKNNKRTPLATPPLPLPGSYLRKKVETIIDDQVIPVFVGATFLVISAILEWYFYFINSPRHPWVLSVLAVISLCFCIWFGVRYKKIVAKYTQGALGEIVVGQLLEGLRIHGFIPIHDVPCENNNKRFNIDHVIIGPKGIFVIETKTRSKNRGQTESIGYFDGKIFAGKHMWSVDSIRQAKRNAEWLEDMMTNRMGDNIHVQPILVFPGWFIEQIATHLVKKEHGVLMLNPKVIWQYLSEYPSVLTSEQVNKLAIVLSNYVHEEISRMED